MNSQKLLLASTLLDSAADMLSNKGCNDFMLPNTPDNVRLLNEMAQDNVGPGREPEEVHVFDARKKTLYTYDWALARFLSKYLQEIVMGKGKSTKIKEPLSLPGGEPITERTSVSAEPVDLVDDAAAIRRISELNDKVDDLVTQNDKLVSENEILKAELQAAKDALAVASNVDVRKYRTRIADLMDGLRLWLRDYPNQILREKRARPDDGSALQRTIYLILQPDGSMREID